MKKITVSIIWVVLISGLLFVFVDRVFAQATASSQDGIQVTVSDSFMAGNNLSPAAAQELANAILEVAQGLRRHTRDGLQGSQYPYPIPFLIVLGGESGGEMHINIVKSRGALAHALFIQDGFLASFNPFQTLLQKITSTRFLSVLLHELGHHFTIPTYDPTDPTKPTIKPLGIDELLPGYFSNDILPTVVLNRWGQMTKNEFRAMVVRSIFEGYIYQGAVSHEAALLLALFLNDHLSKQGTVDSDLVMYILYKATLYARGNNMREWLNQLNGLLAIKNFQGLGDFNDFIDKFYDFVKLDAMGQSRAGQAAFTRLDYQVFKEKGLESIAKEEADKMERIARDRERMEREARSRVEKLWRGLTDFFRRFR